MLKLAKQPVNNDEYDDHPEAASAQFLCRESGDDRFKK